MMQQSSSKDLPEKEAIDHQEVIDGRRQLKSSHDKLSIWRSLRVFHRAVIVCTFAAFTAACDGYQFKLSANIIANPGFIRQFADDGRKLNPTHVSLWGGLTSVGLLVGQLIIPWFNERLGRKGGTLVFLGLLLIGAIVEAVSTTWWHWMIAKMFAGAGIGACQATLPVYINEHSPARIRGSMIVSYSAWFQLGQLFASVTLKARADTHPLDFRMPIYTQFGMIGIAVLIFLILPETPWWLARKQKLDKARKVLTFMSKGIEGYHVEEELAVILHSIASEEQKRAAMPSKFAMLKNMDMFRGLDLKRFLIGAWPKTLQQFIGLSIFNNYSAYFFQLAGNSDPFMVTVILGVLNVVAIIFDAVLIDRLGRRLMTMLGFGGACFGVTLMAIVGCLDYRSKSLGSVLVFAGVVANFFNAFQQSTAYTYMTEMPALHYRALSIGWGLAFCNIFAIVFSFTVPLMLDVWQVKAAFVFVILGVPGTILAYFIMPESTGRSPAEIQELFEDRVPLRRWKGYKTGVERDMENYTGQVREP